MKNRVQKEEITNKSVVIEEFIQGEVVPLKNGETINHGDLLIFDVTSKKYVKFDKGTHGELIGKSLLRVYKGDEKVIAKTDDVAVVTVKQGRLNKKLFKAGFEEELDEKDYELIATLEKFNIHLCEVK